MTCTVVKNSKVMNRGDVSPEEFTTMRKHGAADEARTRDPQLGNSMGFSVISTFFNLITK